MIVSIGGHVADGRDQIVVQVFRAAGNELLHQRHAEALRDAALHLALDQQRVDRLADIMRGDELQRPDIAEASVDLDDRQMRGIAELGIGFALAVGVERPGRRIVGFDRRRAHSLRSSASMRAGSSTCAPAASATLILPLEIVITASSAALQWRRICARSAIAGTARRIAGDEGLPRGGSLAGIGRVVGVWPAPAVRRQMARRAPARRSARLPCSSLGRYPPRPGAGRLHHRT